MNYIKEMNAFYHHVTFDPISGGAVALWSTLMHLNNKSGWQETFSVPASLLELLSGVKGTTFKRARRELTECGFIEVTAGKGSKSATYRMISLADKMVGHTGYVATETKSSYEDSPTTDNQSQHESTEENTDTGKETEAHTGNKSEGAAAKEAHNLARGMVHNQNHNSACKSDRNMAHSPAPLFKQYINKTQTKEKPKKQLLPSNCDSDAIHFYQENFGMVSPYVTEDLTNWIQNAGEALVLHAMKQALDQGKANWSYVKGILKAWLRKGVKTVEQAEAEATAFRQKNNRGNWNNSQQEEVIPDWFKERQQKQAAKRAEQQRADAHKEVDMEAFNELLAEFTGRDGEETSYINSVQN
ncbi:DnaD domain-containing protein [Virgibacillus ihumii]|uniref:DnaD domain-containing protein n=1 Tax=Virgibacillus ihumii TaxID=2686091 RepID=UPI00157BE76A|nr:DnaD domain protein [Virgibacillus ihumii]